MENTKSITFTLSSTDVLDAATGPATIRMTNNYLFRALLQRNNRVLKSLIRPLLHLVPEEIISVEITNSIELGATHSLKPKPR